MSRPITQKAKSPLKQVRVGSAGEDLSTDVSMVSRKSETTPDQVIPGKTTTTVKDFNKTWDKEAAGGLTYAEWKALPGNKEKEQAFINRMTTTTKEPDQVIKGATTTSEKSYTPQIRDSYTGITPWENRFNMRTARQSERFSRNEAKRVLRRQATEAARRARRDEGMSMSESLKLRQGIMRGDD